MRDAGSDAGSGAGRGAGRATRFGAGGAGRTGPLAGAALPGAALGRLVTAMGGLLARGFVCARTSGAAGGVIAARGVTAGAGGGVIGVGGGRGGGAGGGRGAGVA